MQVKSVDSLVDLVNLSETSRSSLYKYMYTRERILNVVKEYFKTKAVNEYAQTWSSGTLY